MSEVGQIIQSILPAILIGGVIILLVHKFFQQEKMRRNVELRKSLTQLSLPMRLQAYERLVLLLERITPENMLFRVYKPGMSARLFQSELLNVIRSEFEHNLTQQLYVSPQVWEVIKRSKEELIKVINIATAKTGDQGSGIDLTKNILMMYASLPKNPIAFSLEALKKEVKQYM